MTFAPSEVGNGRRFQTPSLEHPNDVRAVLTSCGAAIPTSVRCDGQCCTSVLGVSLRTVARHTVAASEPFTSFESRSTGEIDILVPFTFERLEC